MERLDEHLTPIWTWVEALGIPVVEGVARVGEPIPCLLYTVAEQTISACVYITSCMTSMPMLARAAS